MGEATDPDLTVPGFLGDEELDEEGACALLLGWGHPDPRRWLDSMMAQERLSGPRLGAPDLWRELLRDECDKLYNQAWCAYDHIREAEDEESVWMLAMDDLPSAVEQAFSLAPALAGEHLALMMRYRPESHAQLCRELGVGTDREDRERAECLAFWEENADGISDLRRTLYRLVREELIRRSGDGTP